MPSARKLIVLVLSAPPLNSRRTATVAWTAAGHEYAAASNGSAANARPMPSGQLDTRLAMAVMISRPAVCQVRVQAV